MKLHLWLLLATTPFGCRHTPKTTTAAIIASNARVVVHRHTPVDRQTVIYRWYNAPAKPSIDTAWGLLDATAKYFQSLPIEKRSQSGQFSGDQSGPGAYFASTLEHSFGFGRYLTALSLPPDTDIVDVAQAFPDDRNKALQSDAKLISYAWESSHPSAPKSTAFVLRGLSGLDQSMIHVYDRGTNDGANRHPTSVPYARPATDLFDAIDVITSTDFSAFLKMTTTDTSSISIINYGSRSYMDVLLAAGGKDLASLSSEDRSSLLISFSSFNRSPAEMVSDKVLTAASNYGLIKAANVSLNYQQFTDQIIATLDAKDPSIVKNLRSHLDLSATYREKAQDANILNWQEGTGRDAVFIDDVDGTDDALDNPDQPKPADAAKPDGGATPTPKDDPHGRA